MNRIVFTRAGTKTRAQKRKAERVKKQRWRGRYYDMGLLRIEIWAHPDDRPELKKVELALLQARGITLDSDRG